MFDLLVEVLRAHKVARLIRKSALFKREWYLDRYPDVKEKKMRTSILSIISSGTGEVKTDP